MAPEGLPGRVPWLLLRFSRWRRGWSQACGGWLGSLLDVATEHRLEASWADIAQVKLKEEW